MLAIKTKNGKRKYDNGKCASSKVSVNLKKALIFETSGLKTKELKIATIKATKKIEVIEAFTFAPNIL